MNQYTEADKRSFRLKDLLNSKMSAIKAASLINEGNNGIEPIDVLKEAEHYFKWLTAEQNFSDLTQPEKPKKEPAKKKQAIGVLPTPTTVQQDVLESLANMIGRELNDDLKEKVLDWAEEKYQIRKYAENPTSIPAIVDWIKNGVVFTPDGNIFGE